MRRLLFACAALGLFIVTGCEGRRRGDLVPYRDPCRRFVSCGECTPIRGCGWCSSGQNQGGICLSSPNQCPGNQFTWTWEPNVCAGDGGAATRDAPPATDATAAVDTAVATDATNATDAAGDGAICRWPASANTFSSGDGAVSGCLPSTGGTLCSSGQYALSCYGNGTAAPVAPDGALQCAVVPVPTPSNVLLYCCPCGS
jgi:hypothetical protein